MAKNKALGVGVAVAGIGALGLAAYALSQSKGDGQKEASQMLSGGYGGGATGGYSDTISDVLNKVTQTPQAQTPTFIINPSSENIEPTIPTLLNPSDEKSDVKQGTNTRRGESATIPNTAGNAYDAFFKQLVDDGEATYSGGGVYIPSSIGANANNQAVEYNPFTFAPTKKQADFSSYNQGKTGGTANTPSRAQQEFQSNKVYDVGTKRSDSAGAQALIGSISSGSSSKPSGGKSSGESKPSGNVISNAVNTVTSTVGSVISALFRGK